MAPLNLEKIKLEKKGDSASLENNKAQATLFWKTPVDLDLWCMYILKGDAPPKKKGFFKKLGAALTGGADSVNVGEIYFQKKGSIHKPPFIRLDKDSGIGGNVDTNAGNEENIHFGDLNAIDHLIIVANIYGQTTNFAKFGGNVTVKCGSHAIEVPLTESSTGSWCTVARIDNTGLKPQLINVNKTQRTKPEIADFT